MDLSTIGPAPSCGYGGARTHTRKPRTEIYNLEFASCRLCERILPRLPLIEDLTNQPITAGSWLMVEYTGASQWYNACLTIAAGWLKTGGRVSYSAYAWPPEKVRSHLNVLGLKVEELEKEDRLRIWDWYTATLGRKSKEKLSVDSLKTVDLSISFSREVMADHLVLGRQPYGPEWLRIADNGSTLARFNDEKTWVEFRLTRDIPSASATKSTAIVAFIKGLHSSWAYEQLEAAVDGIIDFKLDETSDPAQNLMRIKTLRNVGFDGRWHKLKVAENLEVTLEK